MFKSWTRYDVVSSALVVAAVLALDYAANPTGFWYAAALLVR